MHGSTLIGGSSTNVDEDLEEFAEHTQQLGLDAWVDASWGVR